MNDVARLAMLLKSKPRRGAAVVEFSIVAPVAFLMLLGLMVGSMGIFRYQEVADLARESSRWASVHGTGYQAMTGQPAATGQDVYNNVIVPKGVALNLSKLTYSVTWNTSNSPYHTKIVGGILNGDVVAVTNTVSVTINYTWIPEAYLGGVTFSSTSTTVMSN
jgi:Flp pilus assembly protein TadG